MTRAVVMIALACGLVACGGGGSGPVIDSLSPTAAARGAQLEILGERFCGDDDDRADAEGACTTPPNGFVNLGMDADVVRATVRAWKDESIIVEVPQAAPVGPTLVIVTVNGVSSNAADFEVQ